MVGITTAQLPSVRPAFKSKKAQSQIDVCRSCIGRKSILTHQTPLLSARCVRVRKFELKPINQQDRKADGRA